MYIIYNGLLLAIINVMYIRNKDIYYLKCMSRNFLRVPKGSMNRVNISRPTRLWNVLLLNIDVNFSINTFEQNLRI